MKGTPADKRKLARYRAALPYGAAKEAARIASVAPKSVYEYLRGLYDSSRIEFAVLQVIKEHREKLETAQRAAGILK